AAVGLSSIVLLWGLGFLSQSQESYSTGISQSNARIGEQFEVEETYWRDNGSITFYVRNFGDQPVTIDRVMINGVPEDVGPVVVTARNVSPVTCCSWDPATAYTIRIGSNRGTYHEFEASSP
ncbi:MAG: hypothetical protein ACE5KU_06450, partial [Nitrososphaerales archaeon]